MIDSQPQAVAGLTPPQRAEALIRERWPTVARSPAIAGLGRKLTGTIILAPLAWLLMAGLFFSKVLPFTACRYTLTNRRLMIRRGWSAKVAQEVPLEKIAEVHIEYDDNSEFFRSGDMKILDDTGKELLALKAVREPEAFKHAILNARNAWYPKKKPAAAAPATA